MNKEQRADTLFEEIIKKQKELDKLIEQLHLLDEEACMEVCEFLREGEY